MYFLDNRPQCSWMLMSGFWPSIRWTMGTRCHSGKSLVMYHLWLALRASWSVWSWSSIITTQKVGSLKLYVYPFLRMRVLRTLIMTLWILIAQLPCFSTAWHARVGNVGYHMQSSACISSLGVRDISFIVVVTDLSWPVVIQIQMRTFINSITSVHHHLGWFSSS